MESKHTYCCPVARFAGLYLCRGIDSSADLDRSWFFFWQSWTLPIRFHQSARSCSWIKSICDTHFVSPTSIWRCGCPAQVLEYLKTAPIFWGRWLIECSSALVRRFVRPLPICSPSAVLLTCYLACIMMSFHKVKHVCHSFRMLIFCVQGGIHLLDKVAY